MSIFCLVMHVLYVYALWVLSGCFGTRSGFFWRRQVGNPDRPSHTIRKAKSVHTAAFQAMRY